VPVFKQYTSVLARGVRAFVNLEVGFVRAGASLDFRPAEKRGEWAASRDGTLEQVRRQLANKDRELAELRAKLDGYSAGARRINPENVVWIFGDGRVGSTWLMNMVAELKGQTLWREPMLGLLFGYLYYFWADEKRYETRHFILGRHKESWLRSIRNFVLDEATTRFPDLGQDEYLVVKEPNGSIGAPLLIEALPESRMIFLVRDPRDVVASSMDAHRKGSWHYERRNMQTSLVDEQPDAFVEKRAHKYLWYVGNSKLAYDAHWGPKVLVKYEELRVDTLGTMKRIYSTLGIPVDERQLELAVKKHSWESIREEQKGEGKFHRKATPGGWREDLTPEQIETVERITAPLLEEFYSYEGQSKSLPDQLASSRQWMRMIYGP
jgi:hypothetical protein